MIVWVIAGLLGLATGIRIGWALVHRQSVVSGAMILALGSLGLLAALNWPPLTLLVDTALRWPNISVGLSQVALVWSAAGSCVMITSVATDRGPKVTRRLAILQYSLAALIAAVSLGLFLFGDRQPEMSPREYLARNLGSSNTALPWLVPLLYVLMALTLVFWVGVRLSNPSRRGRALFVFTAGIALIVGATAFLMIRAVGSTYLVSVGTAATLLMCAMATVAAGSLLPTVEDWVGARRELRLIEPLRREMQRRHPNVGIGVRPRGPLVFRVAERLSLISDSLYLEAAAAQRGVPDRDGVEILGASPSERALAVARWVHASRDDAGAAFPGRAWLSQPEEYSDREWILEIARNYELLDRSDAGESGRSRVEPGRAGKA
ncbi:MAG: hypothetical protein EBU54_06095 [Mycobacteriaceae bacterium]|nr:hypothetical protein [Mycobacterium sp.]NBP84776.1 hypothetical protein [Mycobacteriaceae bacterium]